MRAELIRKNFRTVQTTGEFLVYDSSGKVIFDAKSLELDVDGNKEGESCIPEGTYSLIPLINRHEGAKYTKERYGYFPYLVKDVPNRRGILFHHGNFYSDILGCILLGDKHVDLNTDNLEDVANSVDTMKALNKVLKEPCELDIYRHNITKAEPKDQYIHEDPFN